MLEELDDDVEQTRLLLKQKMLIIEQLEKETGLKAVDYHIEIAKYHASQRPGAYRPIKGDLTDEILAKILN